jgi:hypothetical protein
VGCLAAFRVGHRDARVLAPEFSGALKDDLLELELGRCLARIGSDWTEIRTPPPMPLEDDPANRIITAMQARFGPANEEPNLGLVEPVDVVDEADELVQ